MIASNLYRSQLLTYNYSPELAWLGTETNQFGTDEFMKWCEVIGTEPYLCFNFGTGTLDEGKLYLPLYSGWTSGNMYFFFLALAWVEYCNGTGNTYYANLRRKNGREEPYNVCTKFASFLFLGL